ncbi:hypothetical protein MKX01_008433 [Papaver californicum]|nr:hypothetical protein MKX01_008433 [Papaver californicum]
MVDDDVVVCQILSRLPVKPLMWFKCVCKRWKSIIEEDSFSFFLIKIEEDSHFINLHLDIQKHARVSLYSFKRSFLSADLHFNGRDANIHTLSKTHSFSCRKILGPIGGLICLVDNFAVRIYNVSTREVTLWINSTPPPNCNFGFDRTTKKHRVIFMWCEGKFPKFPVCEVLTVGDNTWRVIHELPPYIHIGSASVSANGSMYWNLFHEENYTDWIMAFDIGSEKFRMITIPQDHKSKSDESSFNEFSLSVVGGCVTSHLIILGRPR